MLHGPISGRLLVFTLPLMLTSILQLLFNAADTIVVGRFVGPQALAAVGATNSLVNLFINCIIGISVGVNVLIAHELGAGNMKRVRLGLHTAVLSSVFIGIILGAVGFFASAPMLSLMRTPGDIIGLSTLYLRVFFLGVPFQAVYNICAAVLRANGDTRRPLFFLFFSGILNVGLNLVFVILLGMSVAGVALATVISQFVSMVLILRCLLMEKGPLRLNLRELGIDRKSLSRILHIGIPSAIQSMLFSFSNLVIQSTVNSFGSTIVAGNSASMGIEGFVYVSMNAFSQGAQTFVSINYGARSFERVEKIRRISLLWVAVFGIILGGLATIFGSFLCGIYTADPGAIAAGAVRLTYFTTLYFFCGMMEVMVGSLRGIGHSVVPMLTSLMGACGLRLIWVAFIFPLDPVIENLYLSYPISWILTFLAHRAYWIFAWKKAKSSV